MTALYACLRLGCGHRWKGRPGPVECPECNHFMVHWINWKEFVK